MAREVYMPKMSDHMQEGTILSWLVPEGESVSVRQPILEIETDKAVGEVEAPATGSSLSREKRCLCCRRSQRDRRRLKTRLKR